MKTILVTGITGFVGSHVARKLLSQGFNILGIIRTSSDFSKVNDLVDKVTVYNSDDVDLRKIFVDQHVDAIVHCACQYGRADEPKLRVLEANLLLGLRLAELGEIYGLKIFINTDTFYNQGEIVPSKLSAYILSKRQMVDWLRLGGYSYSVVNLKLEHVYGRNDSDEKFVPWLVRQFCAEVDQIDLSPGQQLRDFIAVEDVAEAFSFCVENYERFADGFHEYHVGTGVYISLRRHVENIKTVCESVLGSLSVKLNFGALPYPAYEIMTPQAQQKKLSDLGWSANCDFRVSIEEIVKEMKSR
ncbi:NAD-dependent epimerase/dehydratase family protein [Stutzerimonas nitrititolerans]|uniref:NAD-dependent epimerase/dehydratase family protein n=1 Tax=Stutzerimonas nitrititolerans TaxID=2482751 RepID=UPI0028A0D43A|nr:NAD-dependent epimerase/dehydratase family protein [Stutzerimonas nitrititolerans]